MKGKHSQFRPRWLLGLLVLSLLTGAQAGQTQIAPPFTTVFSFTASSDGAYPRASLIRGKDGNFYGTTLTGGANGYGVVFKISSSGALTTLYSFTNGTDGANPLASLIQGKDGYFYGTTYNGGANGVGVVFKVSSSGALTPVYSFTGGADGAYLYAALIQGKDGNLYGTDYLSGANGVGVVFRLTMPPIVHSFFQAQGPVGTTVTLLGNNFTETTHVLVGTLSASFAINSDTSLSVLIPTGALTSKITVVNPFGKGFNATSFTVTP